MLQCWQQAYELTSLVVRELRCTLEGEVMKSSFSDGSVASEKKVLRFIGCGETYALGFWGCGNGAM